MCGIFCSIENSDKADPSCSCIDQSDLFLQNRGPDIQDSTNIFIHKWRIKLSGYVLWLQGPKPIKQPLFENDNYMLFNGDIFGGSLIDNEIRVKEGDTLPLFKALTKAKCILSALKQLKGPYSLVYVVKHRLYFARDHYGRRSLLISNHDNHVVICSVAKRSLNHSFIEIPAIGLFHIDLSNDSLEINLEPWNIPLHLIQNGVQLIEHLNLKVNVNYDTYECPSNLHQEPTINLPMIDILLSDTEKAYEKLLSDTYWQNRVDELTQLLQKAVRIRLLTQPEQYRNSIGVLFSGGLDCTILTVLAHKCLPLSAEIHLFNVAFEKNNVKDFNTPDRKTAIESLNELKVLYPERKWKFFEINISQKELQEKCSQHITHLINPLTSILDDSLGCAVWFASRGYADEASNCRLLLVGMGADELFGGYTRHRNAFRRGGWVGLSEELATDWENLPHRNLARDDRVIADHSRQTRTPFLDEDVVQYVSTLPTWDKCYLSDELPGGVGDKLLLRLLAYNLGLRKVPYFRKRALQFGSRIANSKENAKDISQRLHNFD